MAESIPETLLLRERIDPDALRTLVDRHFQDMVKFVADIERGVIAIGGELHADQEAVLLEDGSAQRDVWGANYYPGRGADDCLEYTSLINIRPAQDNRSMLVESEPVRVRVRELAEKLIGRGEPLP